MEDDSNPDQTQAPPRTKPGDPSRQILYTVEETPPWYLCILLGFQHYLTAVGAMISVPLLLSEFFCMDRDFVGISQLIGTIFFVSGLCTLIQTTFGVSGHVDSVTPERGVRRRVNPYSAGTDFMLIQTGIPESNFTLEGLPEIGSDAHREDWTSRLREIQGAIIVASIFQVVIGFSGLMGFVLKFIGPLAITPTVSLIGLSLFGSASNLASKHWWIAIMTIVLIAIFSQYLKKVQIPCCAISSGKGCSVVKLPIFNLFPVLLAMVLAWVICAILTVTDVLPNDETKWGYAARTDKSNVMSEAPWFRFPYPGTDVERGIHIWRVLGETKSEATAGIEVYDLPFQKYLDNVGLFRYIPFCPAFLRSTREWGGANEKRVGEKGVDNPEFNGGAFEINTQL